MALPPQTTNLQVSPYNQRLRTDTALIVEGEGEEEEAEVART